MKNSLFSLFWMLVITSPGISQVQLGEKVPDFTATDQAGNEWNLEKALKNSEYTVIYFYPAAFTGGCTKEACSYRDQKSDLEAVGAQIIGISGDREETLAMFAEEHHLNFTLLSDDSGKIASIFGVPLGKGGAISREIGGKTVNLVRDVSIKRYTFILDKNGKLIYKDTEVDPARDSYKVLDFLSSR